MNPIKAYLAEIGRKGGQTSTPAKAEAARRNAKKLRPRPKKTENTQEAAQ